jgi:hypothetical protein
LPQKKLVVLSALQQLRIYDEKLYRNFTSNLEEIIKRNNDKEDPNSGG